MSNVEEIINNINPIKHNTDIINNSNKSINKSSRNINKSSNVKKTPNFKTILKVIKEVLNYLIFLKKL